jgi:hypothetical protein
MSYFGTKRAKEKDMETLGKALKFAGLIFALATNTSQATPVTFSFDGLGNNASDTVIQSNMNGVLASVGYGSSSVTLSGAIGQQGASSYAGEGYVVGPKSGGVVYPLTLADTNNSATPNTTSSPYPVLSNSNLDGFIKNCTSVDHSLSGSGSTQTGCAGGSSNIFMSFSNLKIYSVSFDFEIFPDGTCPSTNNCGGGSNIPDLELWTGNNGTGTLLDAWLGIVPGASGTDQYSINHASGSGETAPQLLSVSGTIALPYGTTSLDFMDWPTTIAIDNLTLNVGRAVPEPSTLALFGAGLLGLGALRRRHKAKIAITPTALARSASASSS